MKVELEFKVETDDKAEVLSKTAELVKTAQQHGFDFLELEIEEDKD